MIWAAKILVGDEHGYSPNRAMRVSVIDGLNLSFLVLVSALATCSWTPYAVPLAIVYPALLLWLLWTFRWHDRRLAMFILPIVFLFAVFETLFMVVPYVSAWRADDFLARMDLALLGVNPTEWATRWAAPWLTEILYYCYLFYFPMPLILLGWMYARSMIPEIEEAYFVYLTCYYASYVLYFIFPAEGPRFHLVAVHPAPLPGLTLTEPIRGLIDALEPSKLDAFPSLHAAILLTTMMFAFRHNRRMFGWLLAPAIGTTVSLVYCRYHYVVDVVAGLAIAALNYGLAKCVYARIRPRFAAHFGVAS
ncbi:MAG TPA: phosphatase PAP2 family protein [Methylomirabilota bacterium]|nr:phosphatase PAP2 family protein [Methylomirabilota bacterium]